MAEYDANDTFFADLPEALVKEATKAPPPWDEGQYEAEITSAQPYKADRDGAFPCVQINVRVENSEGKTKELRGWVLFKNPDPKQVRNSLNTLKALGISRTEYAGPSSLVGLRATAQVGIRQGDDGNQYNQFRYFVNKR